MLSCRGAKKYAGLSYAVATRVGEGFPVRIAVPNGLATPRDNAENPVTCQTSSKTAEIPQVQKTGVFAFCSKWPFYAEKRTGFCVTGIKLWVIM